MGIKLVKQMHATHLRMYTTMSTVHDTRLVSLIFHLLLVGQRTYVHMYNLDQFIHCMYSNVILFVFIYPKT